MKRSIAARMRWIAPQAAIRPWMIAITAPAAGTIMLTEALDEDRDAARRGSPT